MKTARERLADINHSITLLVLERDGAWGFAPSSEERQVAINREIDALRARSKLVRAEVEADVSREKARALRKAFREQFLQLALRYHETQSDKYPQEYRQREGAAVLAEINRLEAGLTREMTLWNYAQRNDAARLRAADPQGDAATETRRLREQMEIAALAEQYSRVQARNILLPEARRLINVGNLERAQVYLAAAKRHGVEDGHAEREVNRILDQTVPHRRQAIEVEVMAADELELSRRDIAQMRVENRIGTASEQLRASTALKMQDFKRRREAESLKQSHGIALPAATD